MVKIALTAKMRSGKDTVAEYLDNVYGFVPFAFGDALKDGFHEEYPHIPTRPKPVRGYQLYGQLMRYVHSDNIWVDRCFNRINYIEESAEGYGSYMEFLPVITDLRQPNEYDRCVEEGFIIIRINCPDEVRLERMNAGGDKYTLEDLNFETEKHLDGFEHDYEVNNSGSLEDLHKQIDNIMKELGVKPIK